MPKLKHFIYSAFTLVVIGLFGLASVRYPDVIGWIAVIGATILALFGFAIMYQSIGEVGKI